VISFGVGSLTAKHAYLGNCRGRVKHGGDTKVLQVICQANLEVRGKAHKVEDEA